MQTELGIFEICFTILVFGSAEFSLKTHGPRLSVALPTMKNPFPASFFVTFLGW